MQTVFKLDPGAARLPQGTLDVFGSKINILLSGSDNARSTTVFEGVTPPQSGPPLHRHSREDEYWYILEGQFRFEVDGKTIEAGPGCSAYAARGTAHTFQNIGTTLGRTITVCTPSGLDEFFAEISAATAGMARPDLAIVVPIFEKYGLELLGPPLAVREKEAAA